jgi:hypothetical protein
MPNRPLFLMSYKTNDKRFKLDYPTILPLFFQKFTLELELHGARSKFENTISKFQKIMEK